MYISCVNSVPKDMCACTVYVHSKKHTEITNSSTPKPEPTVGNLTYLWACSKE